MQPIHNAGKIERLKVKDMDLLEMMKKSRSIRKYQQKQIPRTDLDKIVEAGLHAPNAGGGQRSRIVAIHNVNLTGKIGKLNMMSFDRDKLLGSHVSDEQPSVIDDPKIKKALLASLWVRNAAFPCNQATLGTFDFRLGSGMRISEHTRYTISIMF